jgi:hypothetical protein
MATKKEVKAYSKAAACTASASSSVHAKFHGLKVGDSLASPRAGIGATLVRAWLRWINKSGLRERHFMDVTNLNKRETQLFTAGGVQRGAQGMVLVGPQGRKNGQRCHQSPQKHGF